MPGGLFHAFSTSATGLRVSQTGIATVSHNIANADTEGYSRQRVEISALAGLDVGAGRLGRGATVDRVRRVHDAFLEMQVLRDRTLEGFYQGRSKTLSSVERLYVERSEPTIGGAFDSFFNAARELSQDASSRAARQAFVGSAQQVAEAFRTLDQDLRSTQASLDDTLIDRIDKVNELAGVVADMNARIVEAEVDGSAASDLRDRRDQAVRELSTLVDLNVLPQKNGSVALEVAGSFALVQNELAATLEAVPDAANQGLHRVRLEGFNGVQLDITEDLDEGEVGGLLNVRDDVLAQDLAELDAMAFTFVNEVNAVHQAGVGLDGNGGRDLFQPLAGQQFAAGAIAVDAQVAGDPDLVAAASAAGGLPGDNLNILALADVQQQEQAGLGGVTFNRRYAEILNGVGQVSADNQRRLELQKVRVSQSEGLRESVEGVSIDDEMIDLTRFQKHFEANSRVISAVDRMLDSVIQLIQ